MPEQEESPTYKFEVERDVPCRLTRITDVAEATRQETLVGAPEDFFYRLHLRPRSIAVSDLDWDDFVSFVNEHDRFRKTFSTAEVHCASPHG